MLKLEKKFTIFKKSFTLTWVHIALFCILGIAMYLRFANYPLKYGFDPDPSRDALIVIEGAKHLHFPLIGPKSGIGPFAFGPWYYYELIIFKLLVPIPFSPWIFIGIMSFLFVVVMYAIGRALESKPFGLLLALIAAFSPEQIGPTTGLSNPNLVPFHAGLTVLFFVLYMKNKTLSRIWIFVWGLMLGIGINHHYQMLLLLPLPFFAFVYRRNKKALIGNGIFLIGLVLSFTPLLMYNLQHNFKTVTGFLYYITTSRNATYIANRWVFYIRDFWFTFLSMTFGVTKPFALGLILLTVGAFVWAVIKKKITSVYWFLLVTFGIDFIFLRYFSVRKELYYFLFFHPFLFLFFGFALWQIKKLRFGWIVVAVILLAMLPSVWHQDALRYATKNDALSFYNDAQMLEKTYPGHTFAVYGCIKNDLSRSQAVAFFLENDKKLSDTGLPIVFLNWNCTEETLAKFSPSYTIPGMHWTVEVPSADTLNNAREYWKPISPKAVFQDTLER